MDTPRRFEDPGVTIHAFLDSPLLVVCPRCGRRAQVAMKVFPRVTCLACGYAKLSGLSSTLAQFPSDGPKAVDPYFGLPLWLQEPRGPHVLWAWNIGHLDCLEAYVAAPLRQRTHLSSWQNSTMASRLPGWLMSAAHREVILAAIQRLRRKRT